MDKRREKQLEKMRKKAAEQMTPEEMKEQRILTKRNLELSINTKKEEIEHIERMINTGTIKLKDETYVDNVMPLYKVKHVLATAKFQLKDYELMIGEVNKLIEKDQK